jgi:uncharacterized protein (TIGR02594 family)
VRRIFIALAAFALTLADGVAAAETRNPRPDLDFDAPGVAAGAPAIAARAAWRSGAAAWRSGADVVDEATRWLGATNPTGTSGPWCADFASFVLQRVGLPPLPDRMAWSALRYGPRTDNPQRGDLAVMARHVGFVAGVEPDGSIELLSGNWGHRVARTRVSRAAFVAFVAIGEAAAPSGRTGHDRRIFWVRLRRAVLRGAHRFERAVPAPAGLSAAAWTAAEAADLWRRRSLTEGGSARGAGEVVHPRAKRRRQAKLARFPSAVKRP